ncbi:TonB-dependent receptor [Luteimonas sp. Y-2-2-4F]|nr:TonB-dependent receptor [Luteimonas sp. Y-2-2-4F]MCD9033793.1 TonB-dependent receptor [Luteimonas sp. Y-2-2-4F]
MTASSFRTRSGLTRLLLSAALAAALPTGPALAQAAPAPQPIDIPAGSLAQALDRLGEQTGVLITYEPGLVQALDAPRVSGQLAPGEALRRLVQGSGIEVEAVNGRTFVLKRASAAPAKPGPETSLAPSAASEVKDLGAMVVTGTRIRGGVAPSPVISIGSERIRQEGFTDLGEVIRSIPQNYAGGQNPGVTAGAGGGGFYNQNVTGGSAANLRAMGQDATLTLINGRRMSYGGYDQAVDISAIPVEAVERIEIVTDGASAIYGSDAVAGVVNVMLKRDFDGLAVGARYGDSAQGGLATREYVATAGTTWSTGGLIATWKKSDNDPIYSDQRDYSHGMFDHTTLYQGSDLRSGLLSAHQSLGDRVELQLDALRTERDKLTEFGYQAVYYRYPTETTTDLIAPSLILSLPGDWTLSASAALGRDKTEFRSIGQNRATGEISLDRPFRYANESRLYEVGAEGPLFAVPAGDARLAVGAGQRDNEFVYLYQQRVAADGEESSRFAYAELDIPLVGPGQHVTGVDRLGLTAAIRGEDHDSYGRVTTPKLGLIYSPGADLTLKASWGKSFKAPTLYQRYIGQGGYLYPATTFGGPAGATALYINGGNPDLQPERARTLSASVAFHPEALPGLETELTWFHVDYTERITQPIITSSQALLDPVFEGFIHYDPTPEAQAALIASLFEFANYTPGPYDPANVLAIIDNRFVNASQQKIEGVDLSATYRIDLAASRLTIRGAVSWLDSERALTSTSGYSAASDILFYPARIAGRLGAVWSAGGFTASLFGNYRSGVTDTVNESRGASFTTFDTTLRYEIAGDRGILADMAFELSAQNLLDRDPPLYALTTLSDAPYDSTNYSAIGRFLSLSVSKRW